MNYPVRSMVILILLSSVMLVVGLYLLAKFDSLFRRRVNNEYLRKNIIVWMISVCMILAISPTNREFFEAIAKGNWVKVFVIQISAVTLMSLFVFNVTYLISRSRWVKRKSFLNQMIITLLVIVICSMLTAFPVNYFANGGFFKNLGVTMLFDFYTGSICGFIYVAMSYVILERQKILSEKELELSRLQQLKAKAELDALHSKVNPHFLYNALNSIADLSVTDGRKARQMTIALADLFRYSINYSNDNYSTVNDEVAMTEVYLQIEKIRFEDKLTYSVDIEQGAGHYLVPRFILQPLAENAVKHGLKITGQMTEIKLAVKIDQGALVIDIKDNGPLFPEHLVPGYGVKSVFDKLDILFPGNYEIFFRSDPDKAVSIRINKLIKNDPAI